MTPANRFPAAAAAGLLLAIAAPIVSAGARWTYPVTLNDTSRYAVGTMTDTRGSADSQQAIGCYHNAGTAGCYATTAAGVTRTCTTNNAGLLTVIRSISAESYIYFQWNTDGTCSYVLVENSSRFKPASAAGY
ncbi:MAG: hypothetical protein KF800_18040 [Lysobacter sp.]|nr:hypothetical protein [Lysobacter sp.]